MDIQKELDKAKEEIEQAKENATNALVPTNNETQRKSGVLDLVSKKEQELLNTQEVQEAANRIGQEKIHSELEQEATEIDKQNTENKQQQFDNKKKKRKIERDEAEEELEHKYKMQEIKANAEHKQMLDKRKKMVEKYGYLYDNSETTKAYDSDNKEYQVPKDFSYSEMVNRFRQFGRNMSKLDRPMLQTIKWILILGGLVAAFFILKSLGILN